MPEHLRRRCSRGDVERFKCLANTPLVEAALLHRDFWQTSCAFTYLIVGKCVWTEPPTMRRRTRLWPNSTSTVSVRKVIPSNVKHAIGSSASRSS